MANNKPTIREEHKDASEKENQASYLTEDATDKSSTASSRNRNRLAEDETYSVVDEDSQSPGTESTDEADEYADLMDEEEIEEEGFDTDADERKDGVTTAEDDEVGIVMGTEADVTEEDLELLGDKDQDLDGGDDEDFNRVSLDDTDDDGDPLNEGAPGSMSSTGDELDLPDGEEPLPGDPANEDEENDYYSLGSDDNDGVTEGTP